MKPVRTNDMWSLFEAFAKQPGWDGPPEVVWIERHSDGEIRAMVAAKTKFILT